jgi:hypothetical protein
MDFSLSPPEMLICGADAKRQVVARDGGTNGGPRISPSAAAYLEFKPDLANAGIDLRKHCLLSGQLENADTAASISNAIASPRLLLQPYPAAILAAEILNVAPVRSRAATWDLGLPATRDPGLPATRDSWASSAWR